MDVRSPRTPAVAAQAGLGPPLPVLAQTQHSSRYWGGSAVGGFLAIGVLPLLSGRLASIGWVGVVLFHVLLMLFGYGVWLWSIPALLLLVCLAGKDATAAWARPVRSR